MDKEKTFRFDNLRMINGEDISINEIHSTDDLIKLNNKIETRIQNYRLDALLLKIHDVFLSESNQDYNLDFIAGMMTKYTLLNCNVYNGWDPVYDEEFSSLRSMIAEYSIYDHEFENERKFMVDENMRLSSFLLRKFGSQGLWDIRHHNMLGRTLFIYREIVDDERCPIRFKELVNFQFEEKFGLSLLDFIKIGFLLFAGSIKQGGMDREYFETARRDQMSIPNDKIVKTCLQHIACTPHEFKKSYSCGGAINEYNSAYKFNPLFEYPLIRPWENSDQKKPIDDKFIAPVPNLVLYRFTTGLYYQLSHNFKEFNEDFGKVFEIYVGKLLQWYKLNGKVLAEDEINELIPKYKGKKPDYVIFQDEGVILLECKATKYTQDMYENGLNAEAKSCIDQISKGIIQMNEFEKQIPLISKVIEINCKGLKIKKMIVSFDDFKGFKDGPIRNWMDSENKKKGIDADWQIIWMGYLEEVQPYITKGANLWSFLSDFNEKTFDIIIEKMKSKTDANYSNGILYEYQNDFINELTKNVVLP
jgi:hypothetical protein